MASEEESPQKIWFVIILHYRKEDTYVLYPNNEQAEVFYKHFKHDVMDKISKEKQQGYWKYIKVIATPLRRAHLEVYQNTDAYRKIEELRTKYDVYPTET